jgi:hypothetical protein
LAKRGQLDLIAGQSDKILAKKKDRIRLEEKGRIRLDKTSASADRNAMGVMQPPPFRLKHRPAKPDKLTQKVTFNTPKLNAQGSTSQPVASSSNPIGQTIPPATSSSNLIRQLIRPAASTSNPNGRVFQPVATSSKPKILQPIAASSKRPPPSSEHPSKAKRPKQINTTSCPVCDGPHHLVKDCPVVADGPKR